MNSNSIKPHQEMAKLFARKPTVGQKAWGLIHKFYSVILDNMERESINKSELAKRLGISRSAVTQMFNKTPNVSVRKMVEIADAVGVELDLIDSISESSNHIYDKLKEENANLGATNETAALTGWICPSCDNSNHPFVTICSCGDAKK